MRKYDYESKLALMLSVLGFVVIVFLKYLGLLIGFFLLLTAFYLGLRIRKKDKSNELSKIALFFSLSGFVFILIILLFSLYLTF